ncbi:hypothetical protein ES703_26085 [subsurface metagenome]
MDEDSHTARAVTHRFLRGLEIGGLSIIVSLGLADRVNATLVFSEILKVDLTAFSGLIKQKYLFFFNFPKKLSSTNISHYRG